MVILPGAYNDSVRKVLQDKLMVMLDLVEPLDDATLQRVLLAVNFAEEYIFDSANVSLYEREIIEELEEVPGKIYLHKMPVKRLVSLTDAEGEETILDSTSPIFYKINPNLTSLTKSSKYFPASEFTTVKYVAGSTSAEHSSALLVILTLAKRLYENVLLNNDNVAQTSVATKDGVFFLDDLPPYIKRQIDSISHVRLF